MTAGGNFDARRTLAAAQSKLVRALVAGDPAPEGFDSSRVELAAIALRRKRARAVEHRWPALVRSLGDDFDALFTAFAAETVPGPERDEVVDGMRFACWAMRTRELDGRARVELATIRSRYVLRGGRSRVSRVPRVILSASSARPWLIAAVFVPWIGTRVVALGPG